MKKFLVIIASLLAMMSMAFAADSPPEKTTVMVGSHAVATAQQSDHATISGINRLAPAGLLVARHHDPSWKSVMSDARMDHIIGASSGDVVASAQGGDGIGGGSINVTASASPPSVGLAMLAGNHIIIDPTDV